jgi:SOS response regulatory protein OraA/RecX
MLADLVRKGVPNELAAEVVNACSDEAGETELERALEAGRAKWMSLKRRETDPLKLKQKVVRFLAGRGFDSHTCYEVLDRLQREG